MEGGLNLLGWQTEKLGGADGCGGWNGWVWLVNLGFGGCGGCDQWVE